MRHVRASSMAGFLSWKSQSLAKSEIPESVRLTNLKIGVRLTLCFIAIVLLMAAGHLIALWQFRQIRAEASSLNEVDQRSLEVLRLHADLLVFRDKLEDLVGTQDATHFARETATFSHTFSAEVGRAKQVFAVSSFGVKPDSIILSTLETIQSTLIAQLSAMTELAKAGDWQAVRLRLENQVKALGVLASSVVETVDSQVTQERSQTLETIQRLRRRVFLILPLNAFVTLLFAGMLGIAVTRSITRPLARLDAGAQALARGEFQHQVMVAGQDELATLAQAFNHATYRLRDLYAALRSSEARFRSLIENSSDFIMIVDHDGNIGYVSPSSERVLGFKLEALLGRNVFGFIHPDDSFRARSALSARNPSTRQRVEFRFRHADGTHRILEAIASDLLNEPSVAGVVVNARDVTDRKRSEEALHELSTRMLRIQGEEQRRIAREVHDSTSQEMTALTLHLGALRKAEELSSDARKQVAECLALAKRTSRQIRTFSYLLHPPMLEEFGLWAALRIFMEEFRSRSRLRVSLHIDPELEGLRLDPGREMVLFRFVQEALANVHRHAASKTASVDIELERGSIHASVYDTGRGMAARVLKEINEATGRFVGVGIPGMKERLGQIGGRLEVQSDQRGTTVTAVIPAEFAQSSPEGAAAHVFSRGTN